MIGFHGQTIFHDSKKKTSIQLGNGKLLSSLTKKIVINNFRKKDLLNDGEGAPLTPIYHKVVSKNIYKNYSLEYPINIINIGGITNITKILNDDDLLEQNHLIILQDVRNMLENHFTDIINPFNRKDKND